MNHPPKDLTSLYAFGCLPNSDPRQPSATSLPLVVDDRINTWPTTQQDNIIIVKETINSTVWNVNFKPVQRILHNIYDMFFRSYDKFIANGGHANAQNVMPSVVDCYKQVLRFSLRDQISGYGTAPQDMLNATGANMGMTEAEIPAHHASSQRHDSVSVPSEDQPTTTGNGNNTTGTPTSSSISALPPPPPFPQSIS
jgi:hypothetical protein